jgi:hypothetical protein
MVCLDLSFQILKSKKTFLRRHSDLAGSPLADPLLILERSDGHLITNVTQLYRT